MIYSKLCKNFFAYLSLFFGVALMTKYMAKLFLSATILNGKTAFALNIAKMNMAKMNMETVKNLFFRQTDHKHAALII